MMQQFVTTENREQVEQRIRPYVNQVLMVIIDLLFKCGSSFNESKSIRIEN